MSKTELFDKIIDLLTEFDEMGFCPTTACPNPDAYAVMWRKEITDALVNYRKQEWISVEDRLPEEREHVIVFGEDGLVGEAWHKKEGLFWWMDDRDGIAAATHWMPLPEPPKMKGGAE